jgi:hypothetical protein
VLALAGTGHVAVTSALGLLVWGIGEAALTQLHVEDWGARAAGALLVLLGAVFLVLQALGHHGHTHAKGELIYAHEHVHPGQEHKHEHDAREPHLGDRSAIVTLFLALTLSPCEVFVGAALAGLKFGVTYVLVLALLSSVATVAMMFALTWLTLAGVERLRFPWLDRNERSLTGALLVAIGLLFLIYEG